MWKVTAEYIKFIGVRHDTRCIIECPEGHPYDVAKQTVNKYPTKRCKTCQIVYSLPTVERKFNENRSKLVEVDDCFDMSYVEIAARLNISAEEAKRSCDSAMDKLLHVVLDDTELLSAFKEHLSTNNYDKPLC